MIFELAEMPGTKLYGTEEFDSVAIAKPWIQLAVSPLEMTNVL
jgi:hypothetical protein